MHRWGDFSAFNEASDAGLKSWVRHRKTEVNQELMGIMFSKAYTLLKAANVLVGYSGVTQESSVKLWRLCRSPTAFATRGCPRPVMQQPQGIHVLAGWLLTLQGAVPRRSTMGRREALLQTLAPAGCKAAQIGEPGRKRLAESGRMQLTAVLYN